MSLTQEQWKTVEDELWGCGGCVTLFHQDKTITLMKAQATECSLEIKVYINGTANAAWGWKESDDYKPEYLPYFFKKASNLYSVKQRQQFVKAYGKREAKRHGVFEVFEMHVNHFGSFRTLKAQYKKLEGLKLQATGFNALELAKAAKEANDGPV